MQVIKNYEREKKDLQIGCYAFIHNSEGTTTKVNSILTKQKSSSQSYSPYTALLVALAKGLPSLGKMEEGNSVQKGIYH